MSQQIIAVDVSPNCVRVAIIAATMRRAALLDVQTFAVQPTWTPEELWRSVRERLPNHLDSLVVGLDAKTVSTRTLTFPFGDMRKAESALQFELEGQIPYNIEDVALTYFVSERSATQISLLAALVPKGPLLAQLTVQMAMGLEPRAIVMPAVSLAELIPAEATQEAVALACLGASQSHLTVNRGGSIRLVRTLRAGGDDIDRVMAKTFDISVADAKVAKENEARLLAPEESAGADVKRLSDAVAQGLTQLVGQLVATFKSMPFNEQPKRLLLTGGLSRLPGLPQFLSGYLGIPVTLLDLREAVNLPGGPDAVGPEYAMALGMAVALFRHGRDTPLNFRRGELAYHGDIQLYRGQFTRLAIGTAAVFALAIFASMVRYTTLRAQEHDLDRAFCDATQRIVGREICDPTAALATMKQAPGADGATIPSFSAAALLEMMSKAVTTDVDVQFDEIDLRVDATPGQPERVTGKGEAASFDTTEQLGSLFKRDACVQDAEVSKLRKTQGSNRVEFNIALKVACPVGVLPGARLQTVAAVVPGPAASNTLSPQPVPPPPGSRAPTAPLPADVPRSPGMPVRPIPNP